MDNKRKRSKPNKLVMEYDDSPPKNAILQAVEKKNLKKIKQLVSRGHPLNISNNIGNNALHIAIVKKNKTILRYLVAQEDISISINKRNCWGQTPLFLAVDWGHFEPVKLLIEKGANVNIPDNDEVTPLHKSVQYPDIAHILIKTGANVNAVNYNEDTPLHDAVVDNCLETVCMLLYYGADANALGRFNNTPFMRALPNKNVEIQNALFDYIVDYAATSMNFYSILSLAIKYDSPYVEEIIKRGANVTISAYNACIFYPNAENFKIVWSNLTPNDVRDKDVNLSLLSSKLNKQYLEQYIEIIMENSNDSVLEILAQKTSSKELAALLENNDNDNDNFFNSCLPNEKMVELILLWLEYGFELRTDLIYEIFVSMGYCELFKILLFMDYVGNWEPVAITPRIIFDIHSNILPVCFNILQGDCNELINHRKFSTDSLNALHYWKNPYLVEVTFHFYDEPIDVDMDSEFIQDIDELPLIPSLLELARDSTRKSIVKKFGMTTASQYYTYVNSLNIGNVYKEILMYEKEIYV